MTYFAAALVRTGTGWTAHELDLDRIESLDDVVDLLREVDEGADTTLLVLEEDDEYLGLVRVDAGVDEPRVFISDSRVIDDYPKGQILAEGATFTGEPIDADLDVEADDLDAMREDAEPVGDPALLADLGLPASALLELCAHEGTLPADVISVICEKIGALDELETLREA